MAGQRRPFPHTLYSMLAVPVLLRQIGPTEHGGAFDRDETKNSMTAQQTTVTSHDKSPLSVLVLGALGVVYGDIGTSPLYTLHQAFSPHNGLTPNRGSVLGILSLIFWSIMLIVSIKYVIVAMRANNRGEGGSLALLAMLLHGGGERRWVAPLAAALGIAAAALFYGDSTITPAVSVLSAMEGLEIAMPGLGHYILPATVIILIGLFAIQSKGTGTMGRLFAPVMIVWFTTLGVLGASSILKNPDILSALSPHYAILFIHDKGLLGFMALGSVILAITGCETLYADMGHFGRKPIALAWYLVVLPGLVLNYFGQGALILSHPTSIDNPFFLLAPSWGRLPLVLLATVATVIASQAVISGAFSMTAQAIQLGFLPRVRILHTSAQERGQIFIPSLNGMMMLLVIGLVLGFGSSTNLAAAYGIAVAGTMTITSIMLCLVAVLIWRWRNPAAYALLGLFLIVDLAFLSANIGKVVQGGWYPVALGTILFVLLMTWKRGRHLVAQRRMSGTIEISEFFRSVLSSPSISRPKGTAVFLTSDRNAVPAALMHNLKHNQVLHERTVLLTVEIDEIPHLPTQERIESEHLGDGIYRLVLYYGYMDETNIPKTLANATEAQLGFFYEPMRLSYFLSRETIISTSAPGMAAWREKLFAWMSRSAASAMEFFALPPNRVIELGSQIEI